MSDPDHRADYYSVLGADQTATQSEIERHYRRKAVRHHPDLGGSEEDMKELNQAYSVLKDSNQRETYDRERQIDNTRRGSDVDEVVPVQVTKPFEVDAITHQVLVASIFVVLGLVLLFIVRFQYVIFLWPLALLAVFMILVGIVHAHSILSTVRRKVLPVSPVLRFVLIQEAMFWLFVGGCAYGVYLLLSAD